MIPGYKEFEFDLPNALREQLIEVFEGLEPAVLNGTGATAIPEAQGIYQLFYGGELVYIGKTDSKHGLRVRLSRHAKKLLQRPALTADSVNFKAVRVWVFTAMDIETSLIAYYGPRNPSGKVPWNGSGFGANDPGAKRENTDKAPEGFDTLFPISIDLPGKYVPTGETTAATAVAALKTSLPYTFRFETLRNAKGRAQRNKPHQELVEAKLSIPTDDNLPVRKILELIVDALPPGWQATQFVSHVILYRELTRYHHGTIIRRSPGSTDAS